MSIDKLKKELLKQGYDIKTGKEMLKEKKLSTGILALDYVLDGGISQSIGGHRLELIGAESTAKTTFCLYIIKQFQSLNKKCVFIDAEKSYDSKWGNQLGVDNDKLLVIEIETLEQFGDVIVKLIPEVDLIIIDSIVSMGVEQELNRDTNQPTMALQARTNSLITRKIYGALQGKNTTIVFINQLREKVGIVYGNPNTTGGGHALKHLYSTRLEFRVGKAIEKGTGVDKERIGNEIYIKCIKNKKGKPYRSVCVDFYYDGHLDNDKFLISQAVKYGIIEKGGAWYTYGDIKEQGQEKLIKKLGNKNIEAITKEIFKNFK